MTGRPPHWSSASKTHRSWTAARYAPASGLARGGYILADPPGGQRPDAIIIASGSEVALAAEAYEDLPAEGCLLRVVSLPSWALFEEQDQSYRDLVLPPDIFARVAVEQASALGWERWTGTQGHDHRDALVRRVGSGPRCPAALRLHRGGRSRGRPDCGWQESP